MEPFNLEEIARALSTSIQVDRDLNNYEQSIFEDAKKALLLEFDSHPVTKEIEGGPDAENTSGTLNGRGNLFTFIGFPVGSSPTTIIRQILNESLVLKNPSKRIQNSQLQYTFPVVLPTDEIIEATPLPFESGNSWVVGIEDGISGFSNFLYKVSKSSRSGKGIETKNGSTLGGSFQPTPYLITMLSKFTDQLSKGGNFSFE